MSRPVFLRVPVLVLDLTSWLIWHFLFVRVFFRSPLNEQDARIASVGEADGDAALEPQRVGNATLRGWEGWDRERREGGPMWQKSSGPRRLRGWARRRSRRLDVEPMEDRRLLATFV